MSGPSAAITWLDLVAMPCRSSALRSPAPGRSRSITYFGICPPLVTASRTTSMYTTYQQYACQALQIRARGGHARVPRRGRAAPLRRAGLRRDLPGRHRGGGGRDQGSPLPPLRRQGAALPRRGRDRQARGQLASLGPLPRAGLLRDPGRGVLGDPRRLPRPDHPPDRVDRRARRPLTRRLRRGPEPLRAGVPARRAASRDARGRHRSAAPAGPDGAADRGDRGGLHLRGAGPGPGGGPRGGRAHRRTTARGAAPGLAAPGQTSGQGYGGQSRSSSGVGYALDSTRAPARALARSTSRGLSHAARPAASPAAKAARRSRRWGATSRPAYSQITVRSLSSSWKHRPLSIAQQRVPSKITCPALRSALLATTSKAARAANQSANSSRSRRVK